MPNKLESLLRSRKLWAAVSGLVLVVAAAIDPAFPLQGEETAALAALLAAYIIGTAIDVHRNPPEAGMVKNRLAGLLASRKFWAAACGGGVHRLAGGVAGLPAPAGAGDGSDCPAFGVYPRHGG